MVKKEIKKGDCSLFFPFLPVSFFIKEKYFTIMWNKKGKSVVKLSVNIKRCHLRPVSFFIKEKYFTIMWNKKGKSVVKLSVNIKRCHLRIKHAPVSRRRS
jgi:hypothetical protein